MTHYTMMKWLADRKANIHYHTDVMSNDEERVIDWRLAGHWLSVSGYTSKESLVEAILRAIEYENTCLGGLLVA